MNTLMNKRKKDIPKTIIRDLSLNYDTVGRSNNNEIIGTIESEF